MCMWLPCMYIIEFHFLLLNYLMSISFLDQPEGSSRIEKKIFLPNTVYNINAEDCRLLQVLEIKMRGTWLAQSVELGLLISEL